MKRIIAILLVTLMCLSVLGACKDDTSNASSNKDDDKNSGNTSSATDEWYNEYISSAIEKIKWRWELEYSIEGVVDGILEISDTEAIKIKENDTETFKDVDCIVRFELVTNLPKKSNGLLNTDIYDTVVFYKSGEVKVPRIDLFKTYFVSSVNGKESDVILKSQALADKFNQTVELQIMEIGADGVILEGKIGNDSKLELCDENGNVLINNADVETIAFKYTDSTKLAVTVTLNSDGKEKFAEATEANIGKRLPIKIDGVEVFAPLVMEPITEGEFFVGSYLNVDKAMEFFYMLTE